MRIVIAAHYASEVIGGEALIPVRLFRELTRAGHQVWLVTHVSCEAELSRTLTQHRSRLVFTGSLPGMRRVFVWGERLPPALRALAWSVTQLERQLAMTATVRRLVEEHRVDVVHQPISVSPSIPSPLRRLGAPVVMGPLNGGMDLPAAFRGRDSVLGRLRKHARRPLGVLLNRVLPGRLEADAVLVANDRTRQLLPASVQSRVRRVSDVGVDLDRFPDDARPPDGDPPRALYVGRLVDWKSVDLLIEAFSRTLIGAARLRFVIVGDGPERSKLERQAECLRLPVDFLGWLPRAEVLEQMRSSDFLVLPSLAEAGGAVILEALACRRPVIAADWGGPAYLLDETCGIKVRPTSREDYIAGLASAMSRLAADPEIRRRLGDAGRERVVRDFGWAQIAEAVERVYREVVAQPA